MGTVRKGENKQCNHSQIPASELYLVSSPLLSNELISNVRYADNTVIVASNIEELQQIMEKVNRASEEYCLNIKLCKTKWMLNSKSQQPTRLLMLNNYLINHIDSYVYCGTTSNARLVQFTKILSTIKIARASSFNNISCIFINKNPSLCLK